MTEEKYLQPQFESEFEFASKVKETGKDISFNVEMLPAKDMPMRVEGIVGPTGIAEVIRKELEENKNLEQVCYAVCKHIIEKYDFEREKKIEQAVRTGLAIFTNGVVSAPIEGITKVKINVQDGSEFVSVYFSGPIRGAGGTGQAFTLILADYCRKLMNIPDFNPKSEEIKHVVEEVNLYAQRTRGGQYTPNESEVNTILTNMKVQCNGDPTEDYEVFTNRNTKGIETNRVRGGMCLVLGEGICLKASKLIAIAENGGLDWNWLEIIKNKQKKETTIQIKGLPPINKYYKDIVAGRPIFAYPSRVGGFRLRYGRTPMTGIAAKAIHPATMIILDKFPVIGTQVKIERPGKACTITSCEEIRGPTVVLNNGSIRRIDTLQEAEEIHSQVKEIIFLGDLLATLGDFIKTNSKLGPSPWVEEWFELELKQKGLNFTRSEIRELEIKESIKISKETQTPLNPKYLFNYYDLKEEESKKIMISFCNAGIKGNKIIIPKENYETLKTLQVECDFDEKSENLVLSKRDSETVKELFVINSSKQNSIIPSDSFEETFFKITGTKMRNTSTIYVGASMGRPEKAKERGMKPPVQVLFPTGSSGVKGRSIKHLIMTMNKDNTRTLQVEVRNRYCENCKKNTGELFCSNCSQRTIEVIYCPECGKYQKEKTCKCKTPPRLYGKNDISKTNIEKSFNVQQVDDVKGVEGLISEGKEYEPIEKGVYRAKNKVTVFRDGTCRFDATEIPLSHAKINEIKITVNKAKELGYTHDIHGKELTSDEQIIAIKPQDVVIDLSAKEYFFKVCTFIDDELINYYAQPAYYKLKTPEDLIGKLTIILAPHISAGVLARIIGFTECRGLFMHHFMHCAIRRNADGDEASIFMLLDGLLNYSKAYLPETRGGKMDASLVLSTGIEPTEIDDEVHAMESDWHYPLEFYLKTLEYPDPSQIKPLIKPIQKLLKEKNIHEKIGYTHEHSFNGPKTTSYADIDNMLEKVEKEIELMKKIKAVDVQDAVEKIINSHFVPDLIGNLHSYSKQSFRCVTCNEKFRRPPLTLNCPKCGGKILLTITKGGITKYLEIAIQKAEQLNLTDYLQERLSLIKEEVNQVFRKEEKKQFALADFL
ncbi:DNA polymerase II large subunit [uncultured archaeon]|nr:DNA polymerase II large subunit [uncultured archaeon]